MNNRIRVPVTAVAFSAVALLLSGCIAYDAASTVVGAGSTVVGTGVSLVSDTGSLVISPLRGGEDQDSQKRR